MTCALATYPVQGLTAIRRSPQFFPLEEVWVFLMLPLPHAVSPRASAAATQASRSRRVPRDMRFPSISSALPAENPGDDDRVCASSAIPCCGVARDAVDHHAECRDRDAGSQPLAEQLLLGEPGD